MQNGRCTTIPQVTKQVPKDSVFWDGDEPSYCQPAPWSVAAGPAEYRIIDRHGQRPGGRYQQQQQLHQPEDGQAQLVGVPAGLSEEVMRPVMQPGPGQVRDGPHADYVRRRTCPASPQNVRNDGAVKHGRSAPAGRPARPVGAHQEASADLLSTRRICTPPMVLRSRRLVPPGPA